MLEIGAMPDSYPRLTSDTDPAKTGQRDFPGLARRSGSTARENPESWFNRLLRAVFGWSPTSIRSDLQVLLEGEGAETGFSPEESRMLKNILSLRERRVDFVFGRIVSPMQDQDDLSIEILCEDPLIVVAREGSKWLRRRKIVLADLVNDPWCLSPADPDYPIGTFVAQAFKAQGLDPPRLTVRTNSPNLCYSMVGHFLSVAPASVLRMSGKRFGLKAVPIDFLIRPGPIGIITLKNRTISPVAQLFIDYARKLTKSLAKKE